MDKSRVKEILIKARTAEDRRCKRISLRRVWRRLKRVVKKSAGGELYDGFYLVEEAYAEVKGVRISSELRYYTEVLFPMLTAEELSDALSAFFEVMADGLSSDDCEKVRAALLMQCLSALACGNLSALGLIRALRIFDFAPFLLGFVKYEQILRRDAVYVAMDRESKALYKEKIKAYAKKRGLTFTEGCERILSEAAEKGCHIGELLPFSKGEWGWLAIPAVIYASLMTAFVVWMHKSLPIPILSLVAVLLALPLWQTSFELFVPIVAKFRKSEMLPRIDMPKIPEESAVLTVITALVTNVSDVKKLYSRLETLSLKTRSRGKDKYAVWGVLLDLPQSKEDKADAAIVKAAQMEVDRLNGIYPNAFALFTRERVWDEREQCFTSHERKRGAVIELVRMLTGQNTVLDHYGATLPKVKYVLTLDADTDMEIGALNRMVGTMEHPLNKAVIGERRGVRVVTRGFGILQPATVCDLESVHKTRFSTLIGGVGGVDSYHSAIFNLNSVLFGKGIFCGKGMFDVNAFAETVCDAFPDGRILSHDILEGTRLRTGYLPDVCFFDSIPSNAISYYNRGHRWARGDVQALAFVGRYTDTPSGIKPNPMTLSDRFVFFMNIVSLAVPILQVLGLFLLMGYGAETLTAVSFFFLLPSFTPLFNEILRASFHGSVSHILRRFFGDTVTGLYRESIMLGYRLSALAFVAYKNGDAVVRALWRMRVSGKRLLEWTTASQSEGGKNSLKTTFFYTFPSFAVGVFMLAFARMSLCKLLGILWCIFFAVLYALNKTVTAKSLPARHKKTLLRYSADIWRYFEKHADSTNNYLPPDNVSVFPSSEVACRTSPTNIGLYLLSVLAALDLGLIDVRSAVDRLERATDSIEKLPKYRGQLYNWYSTLTLEVIGQEYISTVDSGNFVTCLVALYQGLGDYASKDGRIKELRCRIKRLEDESDFRFLFNASRNLFSLGFFVDREKQDTIVYDMYMSEARTTDYYAIARGIVRDSHWRALSRPLVTSFSGVGMLSWSGTCFEYFMPHLLLPIYKNSFAFETLSYAFSEQVRAAAHYGGERLFGISESGYFAFDESLGYQYRAFGIPSLSRRVEECQKVISPYSSFLMLPIAPLSVMRNLEALERVGMYGEFGFYEALDLAPSRVGNRPSAVKSFMSHHLGMSLVAVTNAVKDGAFVKRFTADAQMKAMTELLREAVPADAVGMKKEAVAKQEEKHRPARSIKNESTFRTEASTWALTGRGSAAVLFERGFVSLDVTRKGEHISAVRPIDSTNGCAVFLFGSDGDRVSSPSVSPDVSYAFDTAFAEYRQDCLRATVSLSAKSCAARIRLESTAETGDVGMYFEPLLTDMTSFSSHPAFSDLFFEAEYVDGVLVVSRVGENPFSLAVASNSDYEFEVSKEKLFDGVEYGLGTLADACKGTLSSDADGILASPCVLVRTSFKVRTDTTFVIGWGRTKSEAVTNAKEELECAGSRSIRMSRELFYSAITASGGELHREAFSNLLLSLRPEASLKFRSNMLAVYGKNAVYSLGISGKYPVFLVKKGVTAEELGVLFCTHKLHYIMGLRYELAVEIEDAGYSRGGKAEIEGIAERLQCGFLMGRSGGIHFADVSVLPDGMLDSLAICSYPIKKRIPRFICREAEVLTEDGNVVGDGVTINEKPPVQWSHIIASPTFGTMVTNRSLGNTWVYNSGLSRLTYWENSSVGGGRSEKVYMEKDGRLIDLCASAHTVRFDGGVAEYLGRHYSVRVTIHPTLLFKAVSVTSEDRDLSVYYKLLPVLGDFPSPSCRVEYYGDGKNCIRFCNVFSDDLTKGFGYLMLPFETDAVVGDGFGVRCERGGEVVFVLGYAGSEAHFGAVCDYFKAQRFSDVYALYQGMLKGLLKNERYFWLAYQTLISRIFARCGPYQAGGARGFRDQAQDCLTLIDIVPDAVRTHICRMAAHQYLEGDVQHWWHKGKGVRTHCSDDYLWLVWLTCLYVKRTKDKSVLGVRVPYLVSEPLSDGDKDRYESPGKTVEGYPISHHLKKCLDLLVARGLGAHSLPYILGGDWNDGMSSLPQGAESVWLAFFARIVICLYAELTGDSDYLDFSRTVRDGIESNAFFSDRYARAFLPDGRVLGIEGSEYFEIDSLPQSFAALCHAVVGDGVTSRITLALDSAWRRLYDPKARIFKLFTPPLNSYDKNIGYLSAYPQGVRENGGQYTHAAAWMGIALLSAPEKKAENRKRAEILADILDPATHKTAVYKNEPYVVSGDVWTSGHGGWSWYTGSAAWYREFLLRLSNEKRNNDAPLT